MQIHPEYDNFETTIVKQADTIMIGYPFEHEIPANIRANDLIYYADITDPKGPAMTWSSFALNWLDIDNYTAAEYLFNDSFALNIQEPFKVWCETTYGHGAHNFISICFFHFYFYLAGAGGFLQLIIYGYGGIRLKNDRMLFNPPPTPSHFSGLELTGIDYLGNSLVLKIFENDIYINSVNYEGSSQLQLFTVNNKYLIEPGMELVLPRSEFPAYFQKVNRF